MTREMALLRQARTVALVLEARGNVDRLERQVRAGEIGALDAYLRQARREGHAPGQVAPVVLDMMDNMAGGAKREMMDHVFNPDLLWAIKDMSDRRSVEALIKVRQARHIILQKVADAISADINGSELKKTRMGKSTLLPGFYSYRSAATIETPRTTAGFILVSVEDDEDEKPFLWLFVHTEGYWLKSIKTRMMNLGMPAPRTKRNPYEVLSTGGLPMDYALDVKAPLEGATLAELKQDALDRTPLVIKLQNFLEFMGKKGKKPRRG